MTGRGRLWIAPESFAGSGIPIAGTCGAAEQLAEADPAGSGLVGACLARWRPRESVVGCPLPPGSLARGRYAQVPTGFRRY
jgi:hypothetical protein